MMVLLLFICCSLLPHGFAAQDPEEIITLSMLDLNVLGVRFQSETGTVRMEGIKRLLEESLYDLVLVQEAWYNEDYR